MLKFNVLFLFICAVGALEGGKVLAIPKKSEHDAHMFANSDHYTHTFEANFTLNVVGTPLGAAGGQKDLTRLDKFFIHIFNDHQVTIGSLSADDEPDLLAYDAEVTTQKIDCISGTDTGFNKIVVKLSLTCVNEGCPEDASAARRILSQSLEDSNIAQTFLEKLLISDRRHFADAKCVRISACAGEEEYGSMEESEGCAPFPIEEKMCLGE